MKILILGGTGMLGNAVGKHFLNTNHNITLTYRTRNAIYGDSHKWVYFNPLDSIDYNFTKKYDIVINAIGIIKPFMKISTTDAIFINSIFPHHLAKYSNNVISITTDCVFSGKKGNYTENDLHDALDDYGKSKSLGEPINDCMVIRTSIIGEEIHKNASLIAWAKSQKGKEVNGFTHHKWNGITTNQYAKICEKIIDNNWYQKGLFHAFAKDIVTKYDMMTYFNEKFELDLKIKAVDNITEPCDRSLSTIKDLCQKLEIPTVQQMINEI